MFGLILDVMREKEASSQTGDIKKVVKIIEGHTTEEATLPQLSPSCQRTLVM